MFQILKDKVIIWSLNHQSHSFYHPYPIRLLCWCWTPSSHVGGKLPVISIILKRSQGICCKVFVQMEPHVTSRVLWAWSLASWLIFPSSLLLCTFWQEPSFPEATRVDSCSWGLTESNQMWQEAGVMPQRTRTVGHWPPQAGGVGR